MKKLLSVVIAMLTCLSAHAVSMGTGFFISSRGFIATNYHVIQSGRNVGVIDNKGAIHPAKVVLTDVSNDLAILSVEGIKSPALHIRSSSTVRKGESVFTIRFPNVALQGMEAKVTEGIISSLSGITGEPNNFQISVPLQPGNSGGPLLDFNGEVVGVVASKVSASGTAGYSARRDIG